MIPHFDLIEIIKAVGYVGMFAIVFAESGLFFGFFLPGDSLLFTAGLLASQGFLNIWALVPLLIVAAITGDSAGYWMGRKFGGWLMRQKDTFFFQKHHLFKAQRFYEEHGGKTLILARFIPAIRTFAPIVAGMANMQYDKFLSYNIVGGFLWAAGMTLGGFFLGTLVPNVDKYLLPIVGAIVVISVIPALLHMRADASSVHKKEKGFSLWFRIKRVFWKTA
ncbi:MAG: VTT domain-containing protein [Candidatus Pacebacteria bacterium]|nr:VTT domain-containing protein [Candidatus Paceibacterota bacterium]